MDISTLGVVATQGMDWQVMGSLLIGFLGVGGGMFAAIVTRKNGREANAISEVPKLWERLDKLEDKQQKTDDKLQEAMEILSVALGFIDELFRWGRSGGGEPEPTVPDRLRDWLGHLLQKKGG